MNSVFQVVIIYLLSFYDVSLGSSCIPQDFGFGSVVCVCNASYCDTLEPVVSPSKGNAALYESTKSGKRFFRSSIPFVSTLKSASSVPTFTVKKDVRYQEILGFGGAFTDSAGINIEALPQKQQQDLLKSYFSKNGLEYTMGRVPMASCDFSTRSYSYADVENDFDLAHFKLAEEDLKYKIPFIRSAKSMSQQPLLLFGSPWSSPGWMKTSGQMKGPGTLIGQPGGKYYKTWANYFVRFLQEYEKQNISFWGLTVENEPLAGYIAGYPFQALGFTAELERDFIKLDLGPTLKQSGFGIDKIKLMILDDQRVMLPRWADIVLSDSEASQYVSGVAFHWYYNTLAPAVLIDKTRDKHPNMFFLPSEACTGASPLDFIKVKLGSWERGEEYAHDIIQDLIHWSAGWIDWNLALNMEGGPNWVKNFVDAAIIVNNKTGEFYKQPMYYALAHFSKLLPPGTVRIGLQAERSSSLPNKLDVAAFQTPLNMTVVVIVNREDSDIPLVLEDKDIGLLNVTALSHSMQSYAWHL